MKLALTCGRKPDPCGDPTQFLNCRGVQPSAEMLAAKSGQREDNSLRDASQQHILPVRLLEKPQYGRVRCPNKPPVHAPARPAFRRLRSGAILNGRETSQTMAPLRRWRAEMKGSTAFVAVSTICALRRCSSISVVMVTPAFASVAADRRAPARTAPRKCPDGICAPEAASDNARAVCSPRTRLQSSDTGLGGVGIADEDQFACAFGAKQAQCVADRSGRADDCDRAIRQRDAMFGTCRLHGAHRRPSGIAVSAGHSHSLSRLNASPP